MSDAPRTDRLRIQSQLEQITVDGMLIAYESLERELNQERQQLFKNVETERELKSQKRKRIEQLECENQQLRDGLKVCKEALNQSLHGLSLHEYLFTQYPPTQGNILLRDFCIKQDKALSHPAVQGLKTS